MFTGIVEELGRVTAIEHKPDSLRLTIEAQVALDEVKPGDSIAVNGCCLTVTSYDDRCWSADVMAETLAKTTIGELSVGEAVNLERAVRADARLGGHLVQGHVDATGEVLSRSPGEDWEIVEFSCPGELAPLLVDKGSICVDGVSLTVVEARDASFTVSLIPETLARTTLGTRQPGERVNLEADVIAKHVARLLTAYLKKDNL